MFIIVLIIIGFVSLFCYACFQIEKHKITTSINVGRSSYTNIAGTSKPFSNFGFRNKNNKKDYTFRYKPIIFNDTKHSLEFDNGELLLFETTDCPTDWRGHFILMCKKDVGMNSEQYRITQCIAEGRGSLPDIYDGNETPGVGYTIIGFLKYKINKQYKVEQQYY